MTSHTTVHRGLDEHRIEQPVCLLRDIGKGTYAIEIGYRYNSTVSVFIEDSTTRAEFAKLLREVADKLEASA